MRADEREKLLKEIEKKEEAEATRSMYFRVGKTAHKAITELAAISGANKSEVVRKLVTRGLTGKDIEIGKESHSVKLDWLVRESKRNQHDVDVLARGIKDIRQRFDWVDIKTSETSNTVQKLLVEIYCLLLAVFCAENQSLSKLVKLAATTFDEHTHSDDIANLRMAKYLSFSLDDLDSLAKFHNLKIGRAFGDKNYTGNKIELIRKAVDERTEKKGGSKS